MHFPIRFPISSFAGRNGSVDGYKLMGVVWRSGFDGDLELGMGNRGGGRNSKFRPNDGWGRLTAPAFSTQEQVPHADTPAHDISSAGSPSGPHSPRVAHGDVIPRRRIFFARKPPTRRFRATFHSAKLVAPVPRYRTGDILGRPTPHAFHADPIAHF